MKSASTPASPHVLHPHPRAHSPSHEATHASSHAHGHVAPLGERRRQVRVARIVVFLIMSGFLPDIFMRYGETHVHHLNYGIFLLAAVGGYLLWHRSEGPRAVRIAAVAYGIGLALTFDEFGMWLNLGGGYWQRASFDVMSVLAGVLGLIAYAPALRRFRARHWAIAVLVGVMTVVFFVMLVDSFRHLGTKLRRLDGIKIETTR
jgi:hypothetical protein